MSIQFGRWNRDGKPLDRKYFADVSATIARHHGESEVLCFLDEVGILYKALEACEARSSQLLVGDSGVVLTWDGRLDNREELLAELGADLHAARSDAEIVLAAYERWAAESFRKLTGDWALAVWHPREKILILAKDLAGTRQLYYSIGCNHVSWSTVLDPLVLLSESSICISEEYIAGYLSTLPATHLTPYSSVHSVPASAFVKITADGASRHRYECFTPGKRIQYSSDAEYEEHFRAVFARAVERRLRSSHPVLAELSGGMDSTAIVSMADLVLAQGKGQTPRLDTISYYDEQEPNWNERPFFSLVESKRGSTGIHVDFGDTAGMFEPILEGGFLPLPGGDKRSWKRQNALRPQLESGSYRTLLSGIGGDEFLGGVPTAVPELQDLLWQFRFKTFGLRFFACCIEKRDPWTKLITEVVRDFLPHHLRTTFARPRHAPWITTNFLKRHKEIFWADAQRFRLAGGSPSFKSNLAALAHVRRQLNCLHLEASCPYRVAFPYLDRDLLQFLFAIPREQLVRPGQRRSLMRRALKEIVPGEILARRRKAFISRRPLIVIDQSFPQMEQLLERSVLASRGWVDREILQAALSTARHGKVEEIVPLLVVLQLEQWLQSSKHLAPSDAGQKTRTQLDPEPHAEAITSRC